MAEQITWNEGCSTVEEITRVRALCCGCGNLRTVSAKHRPRNDDNRSGECDGDAWGWRCTGTLKCSECGSNTRHALLRDACGEWRDFTELSKRGQRLAINRAIAGPVTEGESQ